MRRVTILLMILLQAAVAGAHALDYRLLEPGGSTLEFNYLGGQPFSFESYEVFGPDDTVPFQIGRTDRLGRVTFLPDRPGDWLIKVVSDDGHGLQAVVSISADLVPERTDRSPLRNRALRILMGVLLISILSFILHHRLGRRAS